MAVIVFASILAVAFVFMLYVLVELHFEATRPRRPASRREKGLIVLHKNNEDVSRRIAAGRRAEARGGLKAQIDLFGCESLPEVLPAGVRRLAVKRAARS
jgi:hypothetical protein